MMLPKVPCTHCRLALDTLHSLVLDNFLVTLVVQPRDSTGIHYPHPEAGNILNPYLTVFRVSYYPNE